ncbi:hypothetical protein TNIN_167931 [Trichonephila inaurata madagascariensis]|uniref:Uncharacterized protein n=1 Tax=Trichonephila inaurata madagascariensis TaxID=2747483 RepID=A0A8X6YFA6_9ARAC|nr:hypothetical protein TNIN_167931 [Trichonephila inaurata madagascariensis]
MVRIYGPATPRKGTAQPRVKIYSALFFENGRNSHRFYIRGCTRKEVGRSATPYGSVLICERGGNNRLLDFVLKILFFTTSTSPLLPIVRSQQQEAQLAAKGEMCSIYWEVVATVRVYL